jgi:nuclear-control-of-ATPase protein 2
MQQVTGQNKSKSYQTGSINMGNSVSSPRYNCGIYWALLLCLIIPPDACQAWNIPFFSSDKPTTQQTSPNESIIGAAASVGMAGAADKLNDPTISPISERMFGPMDAPHLRYVPSYFSNQIPDKLKQFLPVISSQFHKARIKIHHLLWYKPPVGIVSIWGFLRVMERMYGIYSPPAPTSGEEALADAEGRLSGIIKSLMPGSASKLSPWGQVGQTAGVDEQSIDDLKANLKHSRLQLRRKKRKKKYRKGRCFDLDQGDQLYNNFGGVETVRVRACQEGLRAALLMVDESEPDTDRPQRKSLFGSSRSQDGDTSLNSEYAQDIETALAGLQLSCPPKGSREYFVEQSVGILSRLQKYLNPANDTSTKTPSIREQNIRLLLAYSSKVIELRILDALLRTLRDRHLVVSSRLRRAQNYWKWHLNISSGRLGRWAQRILFDVQEFLQWGDYDFRDRNQKEYERITAACDRELLWLGNVENVLLSRPKEMEADDLFTVLGDCKGKEHWWSGVLFEGDTSAAEATTNLSHDAKFASMINLLIKGKNRMWLHQSESWTKKARNVIADSLDSTVRSSFTPISSKPTDESSADGSGNMYAESEFLRKWAAYDDAFTGASSWFGLLNMVDFAASHQRAGEQRHFQISGLTNRLKQYDFLGIPSTALMLAAANTLHDKVIGPHSQEIIDFVKSIFQAIWGIIEFRFYTPMKDIVLDLLNRRPRMVDPFALMNEQTSLDNMLKDLGVGDGTREGRASALASASRMYEQEVAGGAIRGIVRGRVAQLMLIQIQQLKADLLQGE